MLELPRSFEVQCGSILIIGNHLPAIVLELGNNCVEVADIGTDEGKELIHWEGGTVVASYIDRVEKRWCKERIFQARIVGIDFYAKRRPSFSKETRERWISSVLKILVENYPKPPITLT